MSMDGLASLQAKRDKATSSSRHLPPARNTPKRQPKTAVAPPQSSSQRPAAITVDEQEAESFELIRATVYMSSDCDDWLGEVAREARARKPRVDASRSAVTRLALARLRNSMSAEEIVDLLGSKAAASQQATGRKRL